VREESHLDDMRAAIRGDFERLEERRGEQELMRIDDSEPEPDPAPGPEPETERAPAPEPDPEPEPTPPPEPEPEPEPELELTEEEPPRRSWVDRLLGR
jgi:purine-binding chemotaxis protein CheW